MRKIILVATASLFLLTLVLAPAPKIAGAEEVTMVFHVMDWFPTRLMSKIALDFTPYAKEKLGYPVKVRVDFTPWAAAYEKVATALAARSDEYDLLVSDSQWIGDFAANGHIVKMNPLMEKDPALKAVIDSLHPTLRDAYCTYPHATPNYWGFPQEADVMGLLVRWDLLMHPTERKNFKAKYGYELPSRYEDFLQDYTYTKHREIAEFFTRKAGEKLGDEVLKSDFYGLALEYSKDYDFITMYYYPLLWSFGGDIWNWDTRKVSGYLNTPDGLEALEFFKDLLRFQPPGAINFDIDAVNNAMAQGLVFMAHNWIAVSGPVFDPKVSKHVEDVKVVVPPGQRGRDGEFRRWYNIGGQPFVMSAYGKHRKESIEFVKWWFREDIQWRYAEQGGLPAVKSIVESEKFKNLAPWTRAFSDAVPYQKDFWKIPPFYEMLTIQQEELHAAVTGAKPPKDALDTIATKHDAILKKTGFLKE